MKNLFLRCLIAFVSFVTSIALQAQTFVSDARQNVLIELYTSEGCSSCPPAEEYLNSFKDNKALWKTFVPIALHVDYWDYLGWKDRFASPRHTERQRQYARVNMQNTIYTPGFFVNGFPWRKGIFNSGPEISKEDVGRLSVKLTNNKVSAVFDDAQTSAKRPLSLTVAVIGMGLKTSIKAGENDGRHSDHEFVNLGFVTVHSDNAKWELVLPKYHRQDATALGLVAWVSKKGNPRPIQAVGGFLEP